MGARPGIAFFCRLEQELGKLPLIAEDLGYLTPEVHQLLAETGYPGLKVLQFAFSPDGGSAYLPHRYERDCIVYTGTHDNDTTQGWYAALGEAEKAFLNEISGWRAAGAHPLATDTAGDGFRCGWLHHPHAGCAGPAGLRAHEHPPDGAGQLAMAAAAGPV